MVVKTDICSFSELRIYPGQGQRYIAKDGRGFLFINKKARSLALRKVKAQRITWCVDWRRANKKIKTDDTKRRQKKRAVKVEREIFGVSLETLNKTRNAKASDRKAEAEKILRDIKDRKKAQTEAKQKLNNNSINKAAQKQQQKAQQQAKKVKGNKKK